jgi:3-carboxy-cis,cis-muconate cycloisomerase
MPATTIDSAIFGDIFSTAPMRRIFSDGSRVQKYLDFEAALARVQGQLGIIPREAADEIRAHCDVSQIDCLAHAARHPRRDAPISTSPKA